MKRLTALSIAALALAGCNGEPAVSVTNATPEQLAETTKAAGVEGATMKPGRWEMTARLDSVDAPPALAQQIEANVGKTQTSAICLTPEEAANPKGSFLSGTGNADCKNDRFQMGNGAIDGEMTCSIQGTSQKIQVKGSYSADSYSGKTEVTATVPQMGTVTNRSVVSGKLTGACRGDEVGTR